MARILGVGAAIGIVAGASSAQAVNFNFSFSNVTGPTAGTVSGTITGLSDNTNGQTGAVVTVTSSPLSQGLGTYSYAGGPGFDVSGGNIINSLWFGNSGAFDLYLGSGLTTELTDFGSYDVYNSNGSTLTFTPVATAVPFEFSPGLGFALVGLGLGANKLKQFAKNKNHQ
jgi:hypothetical protein